MKTTYFFFVLLVFISVSIYSQAPTNAGIPDANHVLVVYNSNSDTSFMLANYYKNARNIPASNICPLDSLQNWEITIDGETHIVGLAQETDIIRDFHQDSINSFTPTFHAWRYYLNYVALPIKNWIFSHNLASTIRYIVLCKGVPFKIQAAGDWADSHGSLTVDGLLCMLNTENYDSLITNEVYSTGVIQNPYFDADPNLSMDYGFLPDHFTIPWHGYTVKLSYLVSHLDGISYDVVKGIIDSSLNPDMSGTATWILDADPVWTSN